MALIRPTKNKLLFRFTDDTTDGNFKNKTDWGFEYQKKTEEIKNPRWGQVTHVGKDVKNITIGQYVLIEPLMWTVGFINDNVTYWQTAPEKVMATSVEKPR